MQLLQLKLEHVSSPTKQWLVWGLTSFWAHATHRSVMQWWWWWLPAFWSYHNHWDINIFINMNNCQHLLKLNQLAHLWCNSFFLLKFCVVHFLYTAFLLDSLLGMRCGGYDGGDICIMFWIDIPSCKIMLSNSTNLIFSSLRSRGSLSLVVRLPWLWATGKI